MDGFRIALGVASVRGLAILPDPTLGVTLATEDPVALLERQAKEIEARIQPARDAIAEDEKTLARLRAAIDVLKGNVALTARASTAESFRQAPSRRRSSRGATASTISEERIIDYVGANQPATSGRPMREALGLDDSASQALTLKLGQMVADGKLAKTGERRATRYSLRTG